jgi:hypothetical protein
VIKTGLFKKQLPIITPIKKSIDLSEPCSVISTSPQIKSANFIKPIKIVKNFEIKENILMVR